MRAFLTLALAWFAVLFSGVSPAWAEHAVDWQMNFIAPATPVMERIEDLHTLLLYIITAVVLFVLVLMIYTCVRFRRKANPVPSTVTHNTFIEIVWTVVPILILVVIAVPSFRMLYYAEETPSADMTIKVVGHQWYWEYEYPDHGNFQFDSYMVKEEDLKPGDLRLLEVDNPVVLPIDTTIRIQFTSADVIHSWAMPAFGVKKDSVPGRINESWVRITKPGTYYGQCSELCGVGHGFMPIKVVAVTKEEFASWVTTAKTKFAGLSNMRMATLAPPISQ